MPTTVQQVETLPEGLVTIENVNAKVPLVEVPPAAVATAEAPTETTPLVEAIKEAAEEVAKPVEALDTPPEASANEPPVEAETTMTNVELMETPKHVINCSKFENASIDVNIVKEKVMGPQRCYIMTVHDIGFDNTQFDSFINSKEMSQLRNRTVWLNVTLPGQEIEASDMSCSKYPTLSELADELATVMDHFRLQQCVLLGEGVGATICAHFAMKYPTRCYGLMCIEPIVSSASYMESLKYKLQNFKFSRQNSLSKQTEKKDPADTIVALDNATGNESVHLQLVDNTVTHEKFSNRNAKNVTLFAEAFLHRPNLCDSISKLECDILIATNKRSQGYAESRKFFRAVNECYRKNCRSLSNLPFIETENVSGRILENQTEQFATSLQYFLQGIGLLSAMPLRQSLLRQSSKASNPDETVTPAADVAEITPVVEATATEKTE